MEKACYFRKYMTLWHINLVLLQENCLPQKDYSPANIAITEYAACDEM